MDSQRLGADLEALVTELIASGRYASREDVLRQGVRLLGEQAKLLARLDHRVAQGLDDVRAGRVEDAEIVFERLISRYEAQASAAATKAKSAA